MPSIQSFNHNLNYNLSPILRTKASLNTFSKSKTEFKMPLEIPIESDEMYK